MMTVPASSQDYQQTFISICCLACLSLMLIVPFITTYQTFPIVTFYKEWATGFFVVLASLFMLVRSQNFQFPSIALMPIALIVLLGIQIAVGKSDYWQSHYLVMLYLGMASLLMVLGANLRNAVGLKKIVPILSWTIVGTALLIIVTMLIGRGYENSNSIFASVILSGKAGNIGQINHFSNYMALATGSLGYLWLTQKISFKTYISIVMVFMLALAIGGQRMAIIYVFMLSVGGWLLAKAITDESVASRARQLLWLIPIFIVMQFLAPLLSFLNPGLTPVERLAETASGSSLRLMLIQQAWDLFTANPILGAGWHELAWFNFTQTDNYPELKGLWSHAHNIVMQLLAEMGIIATLLLIVTVIAWLFAQRKQIMTAERWWILALLSVFAIHSMLEYPLWYTFFLAIAALLLGLGDELVISRRFRLAPVLFAAIFMFGAWTLGNLLFHYHALETTLTDFREGEVKNADIEDKLILLNELRKTSPLTPHIDNVIIRVLPNHPELLADKLTINTRVVEFWPGKVETYTHATLLALNDQPEAAAEMMQKAIKQFPEYRKVYLRQTMGQTFKGEPRLIPLLMILQDTPIKLIQQ